MREGDALEIKAVAGRIEVRHLDRIPSLKELVAQIRHENRYSETNWGPMIGRETIEW